MPDRHQHEAKCWARYEQCGEHHAHSYSCGGGELGPECPQYVPPMRLAKIEPHHRKFAREWLDDFNRYHLRWARSGDPSPVTSYAQGCADQEARTCARTFQEARDLRAIEAMRSYEHKDELHVYFDGHSFCVKHRTGLLIEDDPADALLGLPGTDQVASRLEGRKLFQNHVIVDGKRHQVYVCNSCNVETISSSCECGGSVRPLYGYGNI